VSVTSENNFPGARFGPSYLSAALGRVLCCPVGEVGCQTLQGDASNRTYFRITFQKEAKPEVRGSVIVMQLQEAVPNPETDFTRILRFLQGLDLPVPDLYHYDVENGLLLLEDCGTHTLEDYLRERPEERTQFYQRAVELLVQMQARATRALGSECPAYHRRFDVEKLMWEFDFMLEHYVGVLCGSPLEESVRREVRAVFLPLCETLAAEELCFTHRDYHSRNLMVDGDRLVLLDFQDARQGPCQYDLVSLLRDSYMQLDDDLRDDLVDLYICLREKEEGWETDREEFYRIFDWTSLQRNLKAVGTFAYQSVKRNNERYQDSIAPTLGYVRQILGRRFGSSPLREVLMRCVPGLDGGGIGRP